MLISDMEKKIKACKEDWGWGRMREGTDILDRVVRRVFWWDLSRGMKEKKQAMQIWWRRVLEAEGTANVKAWKQGLSWHVRGTPKYDQWDVIIFAKWLTTDIKDLKALCQIWLCICY